MSERRQSITAEDFLRTYVPMARGGHTAEDIGEALGRDAGYVTVKASQLRATLKSVGQNPDLIPKLSSRSTKAKDLADFIIGLNDDDDDDSDDGGDEGDDDEDEGDDDEDEE